MCKSNRKEIKNRTMSHGYISSKIMSFAQAVAGKDTHEVLVTLDIRYSFGFCCSLDFPTGWTARQFDSMVTSWGHQSIRTRDWLRSLPLKDILKTTLNLKPALGFILRLSFVVISQITGLSPPRPEEWDVLNGFPHEMHHYFHHIVTFLFI